MSPAAPFPITPTATPAASFDALVAAHRGILVKIAASYCRDPDDRADLAQDIALQLWRAWPGYSPERPFATWMYRVALNVAISHRRRQHLRRQVEPLDESHEQLVGECDVDAEDRERVALVQSAMQALDGFDRALLLLHLEGCSNRESGDVLESPKAMWRPGWVASDRNCVALLAASTRERTMELDELKSAWQAMDAKLLSQATELRSLREAGAVGAARSRLRLLTVAQGAQVLVGLLIVFWAGGYWWRHLDQLHLVAYGVGLHLYGLALLGAAAIQLTQLLRIDYRKPVLEVQTQLLQLRRVRVGCERALLVLGFTAWVPLLFIVLRAIHVDVWLTRPSAVLANLAAGLALSALMYWLTHRFRDYFERDAVGRSLTQAEAELAELTASADTKD